MRIKCIGNRLQDIRPKQVREWLRTKIRHNLTDELFITTGKEYNVYSISISEGVPWYFICPDDEEDCLSPYFAGFFEVVDPRISKYLEINYNDPSDEDLARTELYPRDFIKDPSLMEKLIDGEKIATEAFLKVKNLIDHEFDNDPYQGYVPAKVVLSFRFDPNSEVSKRAEELERFIQATINKEERPDFISDEDSIHNFSSLDGEIILDRIFVNYKKKLDSGLLKKPLWKLIDLINDK